MNNSEKEIIKRTLQLDTESFEEFLKDTSGKASNANVLTKQVLSENLKYLRKHLQITQSQVADTMGISQVLFSKIENGSREMKDVEYERLMERYGNMFYVVLAKTIHTPYDQINSCDPTLSDEESRYLSSDLNHSAIIKVLRNLNYLVNISEIDNGIIKIARPGGVLESFPLYLYEDIEDDIEEFIKMKMRKLFRHHAPSSIESKPFVIDSTENLYQMYRKDIKNLSIISKIYFKDDTMSKEFIKKLEELEDEYFGNYPDSGIPFL